MSKDSALRGNILGTGLGFRREQISELLTGDLSEIQFFELAPENWIPLGGQYAQHLRHFTERFPFACHGLSLSLGGTDDLNVSLLQRTRQFMQDHGITLYTEHLSWCANEGQLYDLLPIPFTSEAVSWVAARIKRAQDILGCQIGIENASYYIRPPNSDLSEVQFINAVLEESQCFLHLDVNNLYVNSQNLHYDPYQFLNAIDPNTVGYLHVAGHYVEEDGWIVDTHGADVIDPVWSLLEATYTRLGAQANRIGTCLERDFNLPDLKVLQKELHTITTIRNRTCSTTPNASYSKA